MREVVTNRMPRVQPHRRGVIAIAMIVLLLILDLIILSMVIGGTRDHDLTVRRMETIESFYAAEAGMNMAIRELMELSDEDGDLTVGTISDDSPVNPANDPTLGNAQFFVSVSGTVYTSEGRSGEARRTMQAEMK